MRIARRSDDVSDSYVPQSFHSTCLPLHCYAAQLKQLQQTICEHEAFQIILVAITPTRSLHGLVLPFIHFNLPLPLPSSLAGPFFGLESNGLTLTDQISLPDHRCLHHGCR